MIILYQVLNTPSTNTIIQEYKFPWCVGKKKHVVIYHPWTRLNENHPLQFTFLLDDETACALVCCCESCVILLRDLCGICRCLHRIARADRGQGRQKQREKQRKGPYVAEREGEMEISGVVSSGFAPVISVEEVSAGDERDGRNRYGGRGSVHTAEAVATAA